MKDAQFLYLIKLFRITCATVLIFLSFTSKYKRSRIITYISYSVIFFYKINVKHTDIEINKTTQNYLHGETP